MALLRGMPACTHSFLSTGGTTAAALSIKRACNACRSMPRACVTSMHMRRMYPALRARPRRATLRTRSPAVSRHEYRSAASYARSCAAARFYAHPLRALHAPPTLRHSYRNIPTASSRASLPRACLPLPLLIRHLATLSPSSPLLSLRLLPPPLPIAYRHIRAAPPTCACLTSLIHIAPPSTYLLPARARKGQ